MRPPEPPAGSVCGAGQCRLGARTYHVGSSWLPWFEESNDAAPLLNCRCGEGQRTCQLPPFPVTAAPASLLEEHDLPDPHLPVERLRHVVNRYQSYRYCNDR